MERLWENIEKGDPSECWPWLGGTNPGGYGHIVTPDGKKHLAHRLVIDAQPDEVVMHSCDNPPCCNPAHLSARTQAENMRDMVAKGRQAKGEDHGNARLTPEQIRAIRVDPRSSVQVAPDYGVASSTIRKIRRKERWGLLDEVEAP